MFINSVFAYNFFQFHLGSEKFNLIDFDFNNIVPVSAHLYSTTGSTTYAVGAEISLQCDVTGTPAPEVKWFKDNVQLEHGGRVQITGLVHK